jgi:hypothetical protein
VGQQTGAPLRQNYVLRGCAYGDYDNDGDPDVLVVANNKERAQLWRNDGGNQNHWIRFRTVGKRSSRDGIGALIVLKAGGSTQRRYVKSGSSFLSQSDLRVLFGLGQNVLVDEVQVRWLSGQVDTHRNLKADRTYVVTEGQGIEPTQ